MKVKKEIGYIFHIHAYIPYVLNHFFEDWLYEAIDEVYLKAILTLKQLNYENIPTKIMMDMVPITADQLKNPMLKDKFESYLLRKIEKYRNDERLFLEKGLSDYLSLARHFRKEKEKHLKFYREIEGNIVEEFKNLQELGVLQIGTSAMTHPILPIIAEESQKRQITDAIEYHKRIFNADPAFFWSPECVVYPQLEKLLVINGIDIVFIDGFPIERSKNSTLNPCKLSSGITVFGRHSPTVRFLWDRQEGFAGNPEYKDFYREYERVTDRNGKGEKKVYDIEAVNERIKKDVDTFIKYKLEPELQYKNPHSNSQLCITHSIDAEFFGHWCYEGWDFVYELAKQLNKNNKIEFVFADEYLSKNAVFQKLKELPLSSWGIHGNLDQWLSPMTVNMSDVGEPRLLNYIWKIEKEYWRLINNEHNLNEIKQRLLDQMWREILLSQHSDWLFMYVNGDGNYALDRVKEHHDKFMELLNMYHNQINEERLMDIEGEDCIFHEERIGVKAKKYTLQEDIFLNI